MGVTFAKRLRKVDQKCPNSGSPWKAAPQWSLHTLQELNVDMENPPIVYPRFRKTQFTAIDIAMGWELTRFQIPFNHYPPQSILRVTRYFATGDTSQFSGLQQVEYLGTWGRQWDGTLGPEVPRCPRCLKKKSTIQSTNQGILNHYWIAVIYFRWCENLIAFK
jgi:hypothetical protein